MMTLSEIFLLSGKFQLTFYQLGGKKRQWKKEEIFPIGGKKSERNKDKIINFILLGLSHTPHTTQVDKRNGLQPLLHPAQEPCQV